jgi:hypothetical protein
MKLKAAARFFDRTKAVNAYNNSQTFKCQLEPLDMYRTEGTRIKIRNMSTDPSVVVPSRRTILIDEQAYLVSDASYDYWGKDKLRARYVIQGADHVVEIRTISQVLENVSGTLAHASIDFNKYSTDERDSADYHPQYHIYFGNEEVPEHAILSTSDGHYYLVKNSYRTPSGLVDALSNELDSPVIDAATFKSRTYNPLTDTHTDTSTTVRCVRVRWQDFFNYLSQGSTKFERGDMQVFVPSSVTPKPNDLIEIGGSPWRVLASADRSGFKALHVRPA